MIERKLIVTALDLPYPPRYGHKVDQYNRWKGFAERGWRLKLICWKSPQDPPTTDADIAEAQSVFETIDVLPIEHNLFGFAKRLARLPLYPSHVAARIPPRATLMRLVKEAKEFAPNAVVHDGIYGAALGNMLARSCAVPTILRGHNIEHVYFAQQARAVTNLRSKLAWTIARFGLERWERKIVQEAAHSFQISAEDVDFWRENGVHHVTWAPTVYPGSAQGTIIASHERRFDVAYIGNMRLPNNLRGLTWFVRDVLPELRRLKPGVTLCFAGADPSDEARALFAQAPDVTLVPNAPSADEVLSNGRVLVNPVLSGSGVNVKSIDMLHYDAPIVTTSVGVQGFPRELHRQFEVHNDAVSFARAIAEALQDPVLPEGRTQARTAFGEEGLKAQIADYERVACLA